MVSIREIPTKLNIFLIFSCNYQTQIVLFWVKYIYLYTHIYIHTYMYINRYNICDMCVCVDTYIYNFCTPNHSRTHWHTAIGIHLLISCLLASWNLAIVVWVVRDWFQAVGDTPTVPHITHIFERLAN